MNEYVVLPQTKTNRTYAHTITLTTKTTYWMNCLRPWNNNDNKSRTNMIRETDNSKTGF